MVGDDFPHRSIDEGEVMLDVALEIAWSQHGVFTTAQARSSGISSSWIGRAAASGIIERIGHGLYRLGAARPTERQRLAAHVLGAGPGALATGASALALWCSEVPMPDVPVVAAPVSCGYRARRVRLIRSSDLHLAKPTTVDGIPVAGVARALLDASIERDPESVVGLINACQRERPVAFGALVECLQMHARRGRPGIRSFREALGRLTDTVPDSEFERLVLDDVQAWGIEAPVLHHVVRLPGEKPIELDLAWLDSMLDVELDGRTHFEIMADARRDRERDRLLQLHGFLTVRYTWHDYLHGRESMMRQIAEFVALGRQRARRRPTR